MPKLPFVHFIPRDKQSGKILSKRSYYARLARNSKRLLRSTAPKHRKIAKSSSVKTAKGKSSHAKIRKAGRKIVSSKISKRARRLKSDNFRVIRSAGSKVYRRSVKQAGKTIKRYFNLCLKKDRENFYQQILQDHRELRDQLDVEQYSDLRLSVEIGDSQLEFNFAGNKKLVGTRQFRSLGKFKRFLDIDANYDGPVPQWTKRGMCKYDKDAQISIFKMRGDRVVGETVLRRYKLTGS